MCREDEVGVAVAIEVLDAVLAVGLRHIRYPRVLGDVDDLEARVTVLPRRVVGST